MLVGTGVLEVQRPWGKPPAAYWPEASSRMIACRGTGLWRASHQANLPSHEKPSSGKEAAELVPLCRR